MYTNMSFGQALVYLQAGVPCRRSGWRPITPAVGAPFVFKQVPSEVPAAIIPKMTSLPQQVKDLVVARGLPLRYDNQFAQVSVDNEVSGYTPAPEDLLANDWEAIHPFSTASETVGTAVPNSVDPNFGRCSSPSFCRSETRPACEAQQYIRDMDHSGEWIKETRLPEGTAVEPSDWAKTVRFLNERALLPTQSTSVSQLAQAAAVTADALGANDEDSGNILAPRKD